MGCRSPSGGACGDHPVAPLVLVGLRALVRVCRCTGGTADLRGPEATCEAETRRGSGESVQLSIFSLSMGQASEISREIGPRLRVAAVDTRCLRTGRFGFGFGLQAAAQPAEAIDIGIRLPREQAPSSVSFPGVRERRSARSNRGECRAGALRASSGYRKPRAAVRPRHRGGRPPPARSTLAVALRDALNGGSAAGEGAGIAAVAALDGFHYDDRVLHARGHRPR